MLMGKDGKRMSFLAPDAMEASDVAEAVLECMREERFLVLPHAEVLTFMQRKSADYDRWIRGMRRVRQRADDARAADLERIEREV